MQDTEKKRTDDGDKRGEKKNSRLASKMIQYSQFGTLVLQSVKATAAGKYACQATNGIENESIDNKTMSNTVRLFVKRKYNNQLKQCLQKQNQKINVYLN